MTHLPTHAANIAAFVWGVAEASLFFVVPDVLLMAIGLKRGARAGAVASVCAAFGASVGGAAMYLWAVRDGAGARDAVLALPAISEAMAHAAAAAMAAHGWFVATLLGPLSSTPFKLYAVLAPEAGASLGAFALASVLARLPRFLIVSVGAALIGRWLTPMVGETRLRWTFAAGWIVFYAAFFARMPN